MRAVQINEYGPAENLKLVDVPIPEPAEDEVLIKVEAASVILRIVLCAGESTSTFLPPFHLFRGERWLAL
jgi:NADPH2:quinone reductase